MMKSLLYLNYLNSPLLLNFLMFMILLIPYKNSKFHPITLSFLLIIMTMLISIMMNLIFKSWLNLIIILTMIGGLMIIFLYITSLANNELFTFKFKNFLLMMMKFFLIYMIIMLTMNIFTHPMIFNYNNSNYYYLFLLEKYFNIMSEFYMNLGNTSTYFMMNYLYYSLICIMNICYKMNTPLRQIYFYE